MTFVRYPPDSSPGLAARGWDEWADDYAALGATSPTYALAKELLHARVETVAPPPRDRAGWVLDFHCGPGDDLARLLDRGWHAAGCDGSAGMLRAAAERCAADLRSGRLELWYGRAETLDQGSFGGRCFDLVFSTTGGFAYLDDPEFVRIHRLLGAMLAPGGVMVIAHLTPFSLAESTYHLLRLRPRRAVQRWRGHVAVTVRGEHMEMRLRSAGHIRRLLAGVLHVETLRPLLWCTPPFQSGFSPGPRTLAVLRAVEQRTAGVGMLSAVSDQVVCVARPLNSSANNAR